HITAMHPSSACLTPQATSRSKTAQATSLAFTSSATRSNWRGKPLISHQAIVELIAATLTFTNSFWLKSLPALLQALRKKSTSSRLLRCTLHFRVGSKVHITAPHQQQPVHLRERTLIFEQER